MRVSFQDTAQFRKVALLGSSARTLQVIKLLKALSEGDRTFVTLTIIIYVEIASNRTHSGHA